MFCNYDHCFVCYENNVKLSNGVLFVFLWLILFYNGFNVKLELFRPSSLYAGIRTDQLSHYVVKFFHVSAYIFSYVIQWSINWYPLVILSSLSVGSWLYPIFLSKFLLNLLSECLPFCFSLSVFLHIFLSVLTLSFSLFIYIYRWTQL